ncbi:MAG TPA: PAS domain-containing sensor histidine kinase, partial [Calditrichaeota bacterium]|nr:PAS domain-containing sensor histidine kinase [Calditrichota bacterium]
MGLRGKILSGFIILSLMLLIAGMWSINELKSIGSSVQSILDENYQSIYAAKLMKEALEREDSAVLLLMLGKWEEGRHILRAADSLFVKNHSFAQKNI